MAKGNTNSVRRHVGHCPTCGNTAPQRIVYSHRHGITWYDDQGRGARGGPDIYSFLCICETCDAPVFYQGVDPNEDGSAWPPLAYPAVSEFGSEVPRNVRKIYDEAVKCKSHSPMAYALLIRKALEAICDDRGIEKAAGKKSDLYHRLQVLLSRGDVPPLLAGMTDALREFGNIAAHEDPNAITVPMTWPVHELFITIIEYIYIAPARLAELRQALKLDRPLKKL
jgi:hypothetical protein